VGAKRSGPSKSGPSSNVTAGKQRSLLLVSTDRALANDLTRALLGSDFRLESIKTASNALYRIRKARADLLVLDARSVKESELTDVVRAAAPERGRETERVVFGKLDLDCETRIVTVGRRQVQLTSTETALLLELLRHRGRTVTRDELLDSLGDPGRVFDRTIDRHICNVRRKLEPNPKAAPLIVTVHGVGYRLNIKE
jgi:DNA-binding response OmpR family regulator